MKRLLVISLLMVLTLSSRAQSNPYLDSLMHFAGNVHLFNTEFPQEKVYIQFDNTSYYTGETIWFKAFVVGATTLQRAPSKVLYVELVSPDGVVIKQEKLKIVAGQADGSFPLVDGSTAHARELRGVLPYPSGFYEVRAYTTYMLNFGEKAIFSRVLAVYDKPEKDGGYYDNAPTVTHQKSMVEQYRPKTQSLQSINAGFYPESGKPIAGIPCKMAFKVTDESGFGIESEGVLEDTDLSFRTSHDGMGSFTYTPAGKNQRVTIKVGGQTKRFTLPAAEEGYSMSIKENGCDSIRLSFYSSISMPQEPVGLTIRCRGEIYAFETVTPRLDGEELTLPLDGIPEGVCQATLYNHHGEVLAQRTFYRNRPDDRHLPQLRFSTDKERYGFFDPIKLSFTLTDAAGVPFRDRFCLSVRDSRGTTGAFDSDMRTYMLLSSDLKGLIESPDYYFEAEDSIHLANLDLLMLVQGWERYDWAVMSGREPFKEKFRMEKSLTVNGWILNPSGKKPLADVQVLGAVMPVDKTLSELFTYKTDSTGYFGFDLASEFYEQATFTIDTRVAKEKLIGTNARILFERALAPVIRRYEPGETKFMNNMVRNTKASVNAEKPEDEFFPTIIDEQKGYLIDEVVIESSRMYVDYMTFRSFDVVRDVEVTLDKADYSTDITGYLIEKGYQVGFDDSTINGLPVFWYVHDSKKLLNQGKWEDPYIIDTKDIKSINVFDKVMTKLQALNIAPLYMKYMDKTLTNIYEDESLYTNVLMVDVQIKEENERSTRQEIMNLDKRVTTVQGYSQPYSFYSPEYPDGPIMGDVDYRRTLYWNPNVVTDSLGNAEVLLYNNSQSSKFAVSAAGITIQGSPYVLEAGF